MNELILKCWNGCYGCCSFEVYWKHLTNNINEAGEYYKEIWPFVWIENADGHTVKNF
jgi:hypothetical protein